MDSEKQPISGRRTHSPQFKAEIIAACGQPGASIRLIALARGLNPSLVRHWLASRGTGVAPNLARPAENPSIRSTSGFLAVGIENQHIAPTATIRLEMRRGASTVFVDWPVQEATACGVWLREWLR